MHSEFLPRRYHHICSNPAPKGGICEFPHGHFVRDKGKKKKSPEVPEDGKRGGGGEGSIHV